MIQAFSSLFLGDHRGGVLTTRPPHPKDTTFFPHIKADFMTMCHEYEDLPFF